MNKMFNLILQWPIHCYYEGISYSVSHNELETTILQQLRSGKDRQTEAAVSSEAVLFSLKGKYCIHCIHYGPEAKECEFIHPTITCT